MTLYWKQSIICYHDRGFALSARDSRYDSVKALTKDPPSLGKEALCCVNDFSPDFIVSDTLS